MDKQANYEMMPPPFEAYSGREPYVFISYAHLDSSIVYPELVRFRDMGYRIWYDEGIEPGNAWPEEVATALKECSFFVVFISLNSIASNNVRDEINYAKKLKKAFVSIYLEDTELPAGIELAIGSIQAILRYRMSNDMYLRKIEKTFPAAVREKAVKIEPVMVKPVEDQPIKSHTPGEASGPAYDKQEPVQTVELNGAAGSRLVELAGRIASGVKRIGIARLIIGIIIIPVILYGGGKLISLINSDTSASLDGNETMSVASMSESTTEPETTELITETTTQAVINTPLLKMDRPVSVSVARRKTDDFAEGENIDNNVIYGMIRDTLNIDIINHAVIPAEDYDAKIRLFIESGGIPDTFSCTPANYDRLIRMGLAEDMTLDYRKYASTALMDAMEYPGTTAYQSALRDGKLYGLPLTYEAANDVNLVYIRKDWLENLDMKEPETMEELYARSEAFVKMDPDGNNIADTYGIVMDKNLNNEFRSIMNANDAYPFVYMKDGTNRYTYGSLNPEVRSTLEKISGLVKSGIINIDIRDEGKDLNMSLFMDGRAGIYFGPYWSPWWPLYSAMEKDSRARWTVIAVPPDKGAKGDPYMPPSPMYYQVVRKGFDAPRALIVLMNGILASSMMDDGSEFFNALQKTMTNEKYKDVDITQYFPFFVEHPYNMTGISFGKVEEALKKSDTTGLNPDQRIYYDDVKSYTDNPDKLNAWVRFFIYTKSIPALGQLRDYKTTDWLGWQTPTMLEKEEYLNNLEKETFLKIITGGFTIDEFDKFVNTWHESGGDQILKELDEIG